MAYKKIDHTKEQTKSVNKNDRQKEYLTSIDHYVLFLKNLNEII